MSSNTSNFLNEVFNTEEFTGNKSFSKEMVYSDTYNKRPTRITLTNSDFSFSGE
jgi:hypothetical protein